MGLSRLETLSPGLARAVGSAGEEQCRAAAIVGAALAAERTGLTARAAAEVLDALRDRGVVDADLRSAVDALVAELDEAQWDVQDRVDAGTAGVEDHLVAFRRARAASSVAFAADADARTAALEGLYEASAAVDDLDALLSAVLPVLV